MGIKVIITGATGMVGEGVMLECLSNTAISEVLIVNRKHHELQHPKLAELLIPDFMKLEGFAEQLTGYDACFYCAGVSSLGLSEEDYTYITYDITLNFAQKLASLNENMVFTFVSGAQTDGTEKGKVMWARVKGKTENALALLSFKSEYNFRPGFMKPMPGQHNINNFYKLLTWLYPLFKLLFPTHGCTLKEVGVAMINSVLKGYPKHVLEVDDIVLLASE